MPHSISYLAWAAGLCTASGCVPWNGGLAWAGYAAGANWQRVELHYCRADPMSGPVSVGHGEQRRTN
jgi:membrane protein DedA with SNARE-associated domain